MSEIVEAVAKAIAPELFKAHVELLQSLILSGDPPAIAKYTADTAYPLKPAMDKARAAIEAYEAEKRWQIVENLGEP